MAPTTSCKYSAGMGNTYTILKWVALTSILCGCKSLGLETPSPTAVSSTSLQSVREHTQTAVNDINKDVVAILQETANSQAALATVQATETVEQKLLVEQVVTSLQEIEHKAENIVEATKDIQTESNKLAGLTNQVNKLEQKLVTLSSAVEGSRVKALEKLYGYITMFWVIGFILLAGGAAVSLFLNKTYGAAMCLLGVLMLGFASASQYYMEEIAFVGAILLIVGFAVGVVMIIWSVLKGNRNDIAIKEVVEMMEILKETITEDEQVRLFGETGLASKVQSDITKSIVAKIREKNGFAKLKDLEPQTP